MTKDVPGHSLILSHPTGNQVSRHVAIGLNRASILKEFWTSLNWNSKLPIDRFLPQALKGELRRRSFPLLPGTSINTFPWTELARLISQRVSGSKRFPGLTEFFSVDRTYQAIDRKVARRLGSKAYYTGVYAYEDGAQESFTVAERSGVRCFYDLPIGYWRLYRRIMSEEAERLPEWAETLGGKNDSSAKLDRKDRELVLADLILVASSFTKRSLELFPGALSKPVVSIPYGAPMVSTQRSRTSGNSPIKVLYVGSLGQRKGIAYLLDAVNSIGTVCELTLLGRPVSLNEPLEAALKRHRWIPSASHPEVLRIMREHDVLVFPSLFEGFGMVILEAMSQGMVVLATEHTAAPDIIANNVDGYIIPLRSSDSIAEIILKLNDDRDLLASIAAAAQVKSEAFTWFQYEQEVAKAVTSLSPLYH